MSLESTRTAVLQAINAYWGGIASAQAQRLADSGHYLQRKRTHTTVPADGIKGALDNVQDVPTDQPETGENYFQFPAETYTAITVNVSEGPEGKRFACVFEFDWTATGMRQRYEIKGPDRQDSGWSEYDPTAQPF